MVLVAWGARIFTEPGERSWWEGRSEGQGWWMVLGRLLRGQGGFLRGQGGFCVILTQVPAVQLLLTATSCGFPGPFPKEPASQAQFSC